MLIASLLLLPLTRATIPDSLKTKCAPYISACNADTTCAAESDKAEAFADGTDDVHQWAMKFMNFDKDDWTEDLSSELSRELELCFFEQSKNYEDLSCFRYQYDDNAKKGIYEAVECLPEFSNIKFSNSEVTKDIGAGTDWPATFDVRWGDLKVIPDQDIKGCDGGCVNNKLIPHMNLHGCYKSAEQPSCSVLMLSKTDATGKGIFMTVEEKAVEEGEYDFTIQFDSPGSWFVMDHVRMWVESDDGVWRWDIGKTSEVTVSATPAPTIKIYSKGKETSSGFSVTPVFGLLAGFVFTLVFNL